MSVTTLFRPCGTGNYEWLQLDSQPTSGATDYAVGDIERLQEQAAEGQIAFIAPAEKIGLRVVAFDASERKLLRQTIPYSLEEDLAEDVDSLHFALGGIADQQVDVAVVKRELLEQWRDELAGQDLDIQQVYSELQLLPLEADAWTLLVRDGQWLLRYGISQGFAVDAENAGLTLQLLLDEQSVPPARLLVFAEPDQRDAITAQLPEMLRGGVEWQDEDYWHMVQRGFDQPVSRINLLQGDYAVSLPWKKWWRVWKVTAILVGVAVLFNIIARFVGIQVLEHRNLALRQETESVYRSVVPRGAVMDPARQLRSKVEAMGAGGGERFVPLLDRVARVLVAIDGLQVQTLNYNEQQSEMRVTIITNGFNDVENARVSLEKAGLRAELTGSNAEGDKTRARLKIGG